MKKMKTYKIFLTDDKSIVIHAEEVVICPNTIEFYHHSSDPIAMFTIENIRGFVLLNENDYCSYAERRDNNE